MVDNKRTLAYDGQLSSRVSEQEGVAYSVFKMTYKKYLETNQIQRFKNELSSYVQNTSDSVALDMSGVEFLASSALNGMLCADRELFKKTGNHLMIQGARPEIKEVFSITRINEIFDICDY